MLLTLLLFRNTNIVLSSIDLIIIFPTCGFLYGGSSSTNDDGIPFSIVFDRILDIINVSIIPKSITRITERVDMIEDVIPDTLLAINIVAIVIRNGNLPVTWY